MKYCKNLNVVMIIIKYYNNLGIPVSRLKYGDDKLKRFHIYECDSLDQCKFDGYCLHQCKLDEYNRHGTFHTTTVCSLTNTYKKQGDCICDKKCSATQNDLDLFFT